MLCPHLSELDEAIKAKGIEETFRGEAWSKNCREWVYYACYLKRDDLRKLFHLADCVLDHEHLGTHDGAEEGFFCAEHRDGIMGVHRAHLTQTGVPVFDGK